MESRNQWPKSPTSMSWSRFRCTAHGLVTSGNGLYVTDISKPCAPELVHTRYTCKLSPVHVGWFETVIGRLSGGGCLALVFQTSQRLEDNAPCLCVLTHMAFQWMLVSPHSCTIKLLRLAENVHHKPLPYIRSYEVRLFRGVGRALPYRHPTG